MTLPGKRRKCCLYCGAVLRREGDFCSEEHRIAFNENIRQHKAEVQGRHPRLLLLWSVIKWAIRAAMVILIILSSMRIISGSGDPSASALAIGISLGVLLCSFGLISRF